jgi:predicted GH43/DUF377 family glycosyl hydrolase
VLDSATPTVVRMRSDVPILRPNKTWEVAGRVANSVTVSGLRQVAVPQADQPYWDTELVAYYSGAEQAVGAGLGCSGALHHRSSTLHQIG